MVMFKGIGRQVVVLKNTDSDIFEEAIFILRDGTNASKTDMLTECERIIKNNCTGKILLKKKRKNKALIYWGTAVSAVVLAVILLLIICL